MMVCTTQAIDEHKLALTRIERSRRPQCNSEQKDKCIREKDTSQVLNWRFYERLQQNSSFNVNSGEATPGCCASRKDFEEKKKRTRLPLAVLPPQTNFHLLLAGLRYEAFSLLCESFTEGKHPGVTLQIPFKVPVWNLRGVCFSDFSRWCIFLSCLVIIKARLCCSIERIIHC